MNKVKTYYPLTSYQKLLNYVELNWPDTPSLNLVCTIKLRGEIDLTILEKVINLIILKNDGLRLRLIKIDKGIKGLFLSLSLKMFIFDIIKNLFNKNFSLIKQYVSEYQEKKIEFCNFSTDNTEWIKRQSIKLFDLYDSDLYSFIIVKLKTGEYAVFIRIHHFIADGWSLYQIANQIGEYYIKIKNGLTINLNQNPSYIDFILKEEEYKKTKKFKRDKQIWIEKMENFPESTLLKNKKKDNTKGGYKLFKLSPVIAGTVNKLCENLNINPSLLFTAVMVYYIESKTSEKDISLLILSHNRVNEREMNTIGMYSRSIPIRVKLEKKMKLKILTNKILSEYKFSLRYGNMTVIQDLIENGQLINQCYAILISNEKYISDNTGVIDSIEFHENGYSNSPLLFRIYDEKQAEYKLEYQYQTDFFSDSDIDDMQRDIENITKQLGKVEIG